MRGHASCHKTLYGAGPPLCGAHKLPLNLLRHPSLLPYPSPPIGVRAERPFRIDARVVLPDHHHCVWALPEGASDFATRWRLIKSLFSRAVPRTEQRSATRIRNGERSIWQRHYWEHLIRNERDRAYHIDDIH